MKALRLTVRQALMEQRNFWRSPEYALFTFALPLFLLLLLGATNGGSYLPGHIRQIKVLVPSILAFGVIAAAYVNLGAKMAVLRHDGVLSGSGRRRCQPGPTSSATSRARSPPRWPSRAAWAWSAGWRSAPYRAWAGCSSWRPASRWGSSASRRSASRSAH